MFYSCTKKESLNGYVYDYDTEKPIRNVVVIVNDHKIKTDSAGHFDVNISSNTTCKILFKKHGYADKEILRNPDSLGEISKKRLKHNRIYLFKKESDFSK